MPRLRPGEEENLKKAVIESAVELAFAEGRRSFTVKEIAKRAGVSEGFVRERFGGRDQLRLRVLDEIQRTTRELLTYTEEDWKIHTESQWQHQLQKMVHAAVQSGSAYEEYLHHTLLRHNTYAEEIQKAMEQVLLHSGASREQFRIESSKFAYVMYCTYIGITARLAMEYRRGGRQGESLMRAFHFVTRSFFLYNIGMFDLQESEADTVRREKMVRKLIAAERADENLYAENEIHGKIVAATRELSYTRTYREITIDEIAETAGVALSTIYDREQLNTDRIIRLVSADLWNRIRLQRNRIYLQKRTNMRRKFELMIGQTIRLLRDYASPELVLGVTLESKEFYRETHFMKKGLSSVMREVVDPQVWKKAGISGRAVEEVIGSMMLSAIMVPVADPQMKIKELDRYAALVLDLACAFEQGITYGANHNL